MYDVTLAKVSDGPQISNLFERVVDDMPHLNAAARRQEKSEFTANALVKKLNDPQWHVFVSREFQDEALAGLAIARTATPTTYAEQGYINPPLHQALWVYWVCLAEAHRGVKLSEWGHTVAGQLMYHIERRARLFHAEKMEGVILPDNIASQRYVEKHGWKSCEETLVLEGGLPYMRYAKTLLHLRK